MRYLFCFFILFACGNIKPSPKVLTPFPEPEFYDSVHNKISDTIYSRVIIKDTVKSFVSITDFGAVGNGSYDNADAIMKACNYVIAHPQPLIVPIGNFYTSRPFLLQNNGRFFTIHLSGVLPNKSASNDYLSKITYGGKSGYAFGIQLGRGVVIENLTITGQYTFPNKVTNANIGTIKFQDWKDPSITDDRSHPYAAISIDPNVNANGSTGGTSDVTIQNCSIRQWMVGICLSPNGVTLNDEMINILEDDIESCRVAIAIGQDQSKTINIKGLKVWSSVHTVVDGVTYGRGTGGGSVFCENWNIAGNCNQLFNIITDRFPLSCKDIYSESLFRIGYVGNGCGANFINTQIDFLTGQGMPSADYLILGQANFYGGMLRYYDDSRTHRLQLNSIPCMFRDMTLNNQPMILGLYGNPSLYPIPKFDNCHNYYLGGYITNSRDTLLSISPTKIAIDRIKWTATLTGVHGVNIGDYILGSPTNKTRTYFDNPVLCNTKQLGRVIAINGDTVTLDDVGLNVWQGEGYDVIYIDRMK